MLPKVIVGKGFTVTLPFTLLDVQPPAFLTVKIYEILEPDAPLLKLTVIGLDVNAPLVTVVIPVPEIEYVVGEPVVAVYGIVNDVAPIQMDVLAPVVIVGIGFTVTLPVTLPDTQSLAFLTVNVYEYELPVAALVKLTVIGVAGKAALVTVVIPVPEIEYVVGVPVVAV